MTDVLRSPSGPPGEHDGSGVTDEFRRVLADPSPLPLDERASRLLELSLETHLTAASIASLCDESPSKVEALLALGRLDADDLRRVAQAAPPPIMWPLFAYASTDAITAGLEALERCPPDRPALLEVYEAMRSASGPSVDDRLAAISAQTLWHLAYKAKQYDVLTPRQRKFLGDMARRRQQEKPPTEKQLAYLRATLLQLVNEGVVSRDSPDGDQSECSEVLEALGM